MIERGSIENGPGGIVVGMYLLDLWNVVIIVGVVKWLKPLQSAIVRGSENEMKEEIDIFYVHSFNIISKLAYNGAT